MVLQAPQKRKDSWETAPVEGKVHPGRDPGEEGRLGADNQTEAEEGTILVHLYKDVNCISSI